MSVTVIPIAVGALRTVPKGLVKGTRRIGNQSKNRDYRIIEIGQNTQMRPVDLRKVVVTWFL